MSEQDPNLNPVTTPPVVPAVQAPTATPAPAQPLPTGVPPAGKTAQLPAHLQQALQQPEPTPAPEPVLPGSLNAPDYAEFATGNASIDAAIDAFISVTGATSADLNRAVKNAVEYANADLVDETFLREKFGKHADQAIQLAKSAINHSIETAKAAQDAAVQQVYSLANGEANWKSAVSVFNSTAPQHLKDAVKSLMDNDNVVSGAQLVLQTVQSGGYLPQDNGLLHNGAATNGGGTLTAEQFKKELATLRSAAGNRSLETGPFAEQYQNLLARRSAARQLGR